MLLHLRKRLHGGKEKGTKHLMMPINLPAAPSVPFKIIMDKPSWHFILVTEVVFDPRANWYICDLGVESPEESNFDSVLQNYLDQGWKLPIMKEATNEETTTLCNAVEKVVFPGGTYYYEAAS